jgi:peptidylprolyl isomerase/peptidyl-prolyl cis-trans isomerase B (cyclophilin B)
VIIETDRGKLTLELLPDVAPKTVARFGELVRKGFYNGLTFHRVAPKFLIQGGDPAGDGTGGSGQKIRAEFNEKKHVRGTVGMARTRDPDSADSQFYICLEPQPFLDGKYTVFGQVVEGLEVLGKIQENDVMRRVWVRP